MTQQNLLASTSRLMRIHILLAIQTLVVLLGSINRLGSFTIGFVSTTEFLRWVDLINMLPLPILSLVAFYLLKKHLENSGKTPAANTLLALNVLFIVSVYVMGASYGDHEVTNYLHARFCNTGIDSALCRIIIFNDDEFGHWLFFGAFIGINTVMLFIQALFPYRGAVNLADKALLMFNSLFIAAGILANLGFEEIGLDLYVVLVLAALSIYLWWRHGSQPLFIYYGTAYIIGLFATLAVKVFGR